MKTLKQEIVDQFIIEVTLIDPIQKIINQLNSGSFRDCDIKWLDKKLSDLIHLAAKTLNISLPIQAEKEHFIGFNAYVKDYYLTKFTNLLIYFKSI